MVLSAKEVVNALRSEDISESERVELIKVQYKNLIEKVIETFEDDKCIDTHTYEIKVVLTDKLYSKLEGLIKEYA